MIGRNVMQQGRRVRLRALESSALTMALMLAGPAFAQCAPDPTVADSTTICSGTDTNGLAVTTRGTNVVVDEFATVNGLAGPAIAVRIASVSGSAPVTVSIDGLVDGGQSEGISFVKQYIPNDYSSQSLTLTVAAGGRVTGLNGVVIDRTANAFYGFGNTSIDNSGDISGSSGIALFSTNSNLSFSSIVNGTGGTIGAIVGRIDTLDNSGTINGGNRSAITSGNGAFGYGTFNNRGTINSTGTVATLDNSFSSLTNSGTIENTGSGAAIASGAMTIVNTATGRIASAGTTAIQFTGGLQLNNAGTITGDVAAGSSLSVGGSNSVVDSTAGRITGSMRLGSGNDTLVALYDGTRLQYGVDGAIDGGQGTDQVRVRFIANGTITAPLELPTGFERVSINPDAAVTATLDTGFAAPGTLLIGGAGTIVSRANLSGTGSIVNDSFDSRGQLTFANAGSITSTNDNSFPALQLWSVKRFENTGTITAVRRAVDLSVPGAAENSGTIVAGDTAVSSFGENFTNTATGVIRSTGGTALALSGNSYGSGRTNAGLIEGTTGVALSTTLINTGTINGSQTGIRLSAYGTIDNRAGGTVSGKVAVSAGDTYFLFNNTILNAGTINGDVVLGNNQDSYYGNNNRFYALQGGVLNGNLILGKGDLLVTEFADVSMGTFAGITGRVTGYNSTLLLRVRSDTTATPVLTRGFTTTGYDLLNDATLTLTGAAGMRSLLLSGRGSVDVTADIATMAAPAIQSTMIATIPGETNTTNKLTITSRGALRFEQTDASIAAGTGGNAAVSLGTNDRFTNAGTITATDRRSPFYGQLAAISAVTFFDPVLGTEIINDGTITLDGTIGILGGKTIINNGSILQAAGGRNATGISLFNGNGISVTNTGTIDVTGNAIQSGYGTFALINSGRIASSGSVAVAMGGGYYLSIDNLVGGTIEGGVNHAAIRAEGGTLTNSGTITGTVDLGYASYGRGYQDATYVADGGTIAGALLFGNGRDKLVTFGTIGVSGTIDGGDGIDTLVHARRASDTVTLNATSNSTGIVNFEAQGVRALGTDTVVTVRADAAVSGPFDVSGDGAIVSTLTVNGNVVLGDRISYVYDIPRSDMVLASFTNQGRITDHVNGSVRRFVNSGTLGGETLNVAAAELYTNDTLDFVNDGRISTTTGAGAVSLNAINGNTITATNNGNIFGNFFAWAYRNMPLAVDEPILPISIVLTNNGTISGPGMGYGNGAVELVANEVSDAPVTLTLANAGTIEGVRQGGIAVSLISRPENSLVSVLTATNSGTIRDNAGGDMGDFGVMPAVALNLVSNATGQVQVTNTTTGVIEALGNQSVAVLAIDGSLDLTNAGVVRGNTGTILAESDNLGGYVGRSYLAGAVQTGAGNDRITNTGSITGSIHLGNGNDRIDNVGRIEGNVFLGEGDDTFLQRASATLIGTVDAGAGTDTFIVDATGGGTVNGDQFINFERFSQIGSGNVGYAGNFRLNTIDLIGGTIGVAAGQTLTSDGPFTITGSDAIETVDNDGTVSGGVTLGAGNDRVVNRGTIGGAVLLGEGDDSFVESLNSSVNGGVDGGSGTDSYSVVLAGNRSGINARTGFERLSLEGTGTLTLALDQSFEAVALTGTGLTAALGGFSLGTVTGSDAGEQLMVDGDVASVALGAGNDMLALGTQLAAGRYDGGMGTDTLAFTNTGPVTLLGTATGFEQVALTGGALNIAGTLGSAGSALSFGDGAQSVTVASGGTLAGVVDLGAGNDSLTFAAQTIAGSYDGGAGTDTLAFTNTGPVTLTGTATGFEQVALTNGALTVAGTLGTTNAPLSFGDGAQAVTVASGGTLAGVIDLGAGNDALRLAGTLTGTVAGGAGSDTTTLVLTGDRSLASTTLTGFETLASEGTGTLTLTGTHAYDAVNAGTGLTLASGSTLTAPVRFGSGDQRFTIAGTFTGSVDGGAGSDTLAITGGTAAFGTVTNVEALAMSGGLATVSGTATLGSVDMTGGRLVGLAGSVLNGSFAVRSGATFGSAGTVNGNVTVAGILSPGASPGTMTVNGNVALASGSLSLFEFTPTAQDKLVINGTLAIASGSTLQLTQSGTLRPGASYDLITASGGITGSFTTIQKPDSLFGFVVQRTDRIQLLGQFLNDASFSPQVGRSVAYANTVLQTQPATSALFAVLPALTTSGGASNAAAFARLTSEAYASATQVGVENALALTDIARGPGFAANRSEAGGFTFGQAIGSWYRLAADRSEGVSRAATNSYGFVGGIGYGDSAWSVGAFTGFINSRQRIDALAARTGVDGWVAGVHGRYEAGRFGFGASLAYHGGKADTDRALPASVASRASYDLTSVVGDLSAHYTIDMGEWALRPRAGVTYIRTSRDGAVEAGGPFALTVAADKHVASFADAGVGFARAETSDAAFRPFVSLGLRYQIKGERADAVAGYAGGPLGLVALGAGRAQTVGTISAGLVQRVTDGLDLFSTVSAQTGKDDHREAITTGVRLRF